MSQVHLVLFPSTRQLVVTSQQQVFDRNYLSTVSQLYVQLNDDDTVRLITNK